MLEQFHPTGPVDMGFDEIYLHNVGRDQAAFITTFGEQVLPKLRLQ
jgi:coenzyme F420-dependent glucose-6-phosphate dehydrogenase